MNHALSNTFLHFVACFDNNIVCTAILPYIRLLYIYLGVSNICLEQTFVLILLMLMLLTFCLIII